jgi:hypothetical protein
LNFIYGFWSKTSTVQDIVETEDIDGQLIVR